MKNKAGSYIAAFTASYHEKLDNFEKEYGRPPADFEKRILRHLTTDKVRPAYPTEQAYVDKFCEAVRRGIHENGISGTPPTEPLSEDEQIGAALERAIRVQTAKRTRANKKAPRTTTSNGKGPRGKGNWLSPETRYTRLIEKYGFAPPDHAVAVLTSTRATDVKKMRDGLSDRFIFTPTPIEGAAYIVSQAWNAKEKPKVDDPLTQKLKGLIESMDGEKRKLLVELLED